MKKFMVVVVLLIVVLVSSMFVLMSRKQDPETREKLLVVASLFPQYDFARSIAGDRADVIMILPPGVESHTFEPKPSDILTIEKADLFIYTGKDMEPWADRLVSGAAEGRHVHVLDASSGVELMREEHDHDGHDSHDHDGHDHDDHGSHDHDGHEHDGHDHDGHGHEGDGHAHEHEYDPHIWLDPNNAELMVNNITEALCRLDPEGEAQYRANAEKYRGELRQLDLDTKRVIEEGHKRVIAFGGRFAYAYFLKRYELDYITAYHSCSTEAEPSVRDMKRVIDGMRELGLQVVYHEEFADPKIARSIAKETGAVCEQFSTGHNVTRDEFDSGITFIDVMRGNLAQLAKGLE